MPQRIFPALISLFLAGSPTVFASEESINKDNDWKLSAREKDVAIYSRLRPGSSLKEFKAIGAIDAPNSAVCFVQTAIIRCAFGRSHGPPLMGLSS